MGSRDRRDSRRRGGDSRAPWLDKYGPPTRTNYRVTVENLSSRVSWQDLKDYMRQAGDVTYADAHKTRKNEGVVEFACKGDLKNAMDKLDGSELNGRRIKLIEESRGRSRSRSPRSRSKSRSRSRKRSPSRSRSKSARRSRSPATRRSRSRSRSVDRRRTRSRSGERRSRSLERKNGAPNKRSASRSRSRTPKRSRSRSGSKDRKERNGISRTWMQTKSNKDETFLPTRILV